LTADDLEFKAPGNGLPPYVAEDIIGQVTRRPLEKDEAILHEDLTNK
jgi:sialic acid synthase